MRPRLNPRSIRKRSVAGRGDGDASSGSAPHDRGGADPSTIQSDSPPMPQSSGRVNSFGNSLEVERVRQVPHSATNPRERLQIEPARDELKDRGGVVGCMIDKASLRVGRNDQCRNPRARPELIDLRCPEFFAHLVWAERRPALAQAMMAPLICWSFSNSMFRYLLVDQAVPAMWRSLAAARLSAD